MAKGLKYLSSNIKTGVAINLPLCNCSPTKVCLKICYANRGHLRTSSNISKQLRTSEYLKGNNIDELISECSQFSTVRLNGTGDLLLEHCENILKLAKSLPATIFYGMTKKTEIAEKINGKVKNLSLLVSIDNSSPESTLAYKGSKCYTALPTDDLSKIVKDKSIKVIFPYHCSGKVVQKELSETKKTVKDCPIVRKKEGINSCFDCRMCFRA